MPTVYSLFGPKPQFLSSSGAPLNGGKLYFYISGSTTPKPSYTDSTGAVPNANPVVLNSLGSPANGIWGTTGAYRIVCEDAASNVLWTVDGISGINDTGASSQSQWVVSGLTPTFLSTTSFALSGDQTAAFTAGRRVQTANTGGTITSTVVSALFGGSVTTITVANDSGVIDSGLASVVYALLSSTAPSVPFMGFRRMQGDFSNATIANRTMLQTLFANQPTAVGILPNGTATQSGVAAYNNATPTNASFLYSACTATETQLSASRHGSGSYLPMSFYTSDLVRLQIAANGDISGSRTTNGPSNFTWSNTDAGNAATAQIIATSNVGFTAMSTLSAAFGGYGQIACTAGNGLVISTNAGNLQFISGGVNALNIRADRSIWTDGNAQPAFFARAWVNFDGTTASPATIRASNNVSSVTKNGTGDYTINFTTAMVDANYAVLGTAGDNTANSVIPKVSVANNLTAQSTTVVRILVTNAGNSVVFDANSVYVAIVR